MIHVARAALLTRISQRGPDSCSSKPLAGLSYTIEHANTSNNTEALTAKYDASPAFRIIDEHRAIPSFLAGVAID